MFWFGIGCSGCGLAVGLLLKTPLAVALTSLQIVLFVVGLAVAGVLTVPAALLWIVAGLFCHQATYLAGLILRTKADDNRFPTPSREVAALVDQELSGLDQLAVRIASQAPDLRPEAANLSLSVSTLRRTLNDEQNLLALVAQRQILGRSD